jgi:hypothetical protein
LGGLSEMRDLSQKKVKRAEERETLLNCFVKQFASAQTVPKFSTEAREEALGAAVAAFDTSSDLPQLSVEATNDLAAAMGVSRGVAKDAVSLVRQVGGPAVMVKLKDHGQHVAPDAVACP